jgi:hypothetical protein
MRLWNAVMLSALLVACGAPAVRDDAPPPVASAAESASAGVADARPDPALDELLALAANDFHIHRPPQPSRFRAVRAVRAGMLKREDGGGQLMICGEFLPLRTDGEAQWSAFATIKTSGYEQWLGDQARGFCERLDVAWQAGDWSTLLTRKYRALR